MEHRDKQTLVSEEASEWFLRLKDDGLAGAEQEEYLQWLKGSPDHIAEALRMGRLFAQLRRMGLEGTVDLSSAAAEPSNVIDLNPRDLPPQAPAAEPPSGGGGRLWAIAATLSALVLGTLLVVGLQLGWIGGAIETDASEWRRFTLADGSIVRAGPRTRLHIQFDESQRLIQLPDGEAVFQVAKDPNRPFFVNAGTAVVRAVGTEFGVTRKNGKVLVTVAEGLVSVSQVPPSSWFRTAESPAESGGGRKGVAVAAGQQAAIPRAGPVTVQRVNVSNELAWAQGKLIFESRTTVAEAIDEFNRRNHIQILVEDSAIASRSVRGVFDAADPESFAQFIAQMVHASIVREAPGILFLQPQDEASDDASELDGEALPPISTDAQPLNEPPTGPFETRKSEAL